MAIVPAADTEVNGATIDLPGENFRRVDYSKKPTLGEWVDAHEAPRPAVGSAGITLGTVRLSYLGPRSYLIGYLAVGAAPRTSGNLYMQRRGLEAGWSALAVQDRPRFIQ